MTWAYSSVTVARVLQTKFEVNLLSSFREEDDCWRMTTNDGRRSIPFDTNSSPWAFGSGKLKKPVGPDDDPQQILDTEKLLSIWLSQCKKEQRSITLI
jgi:hypothetical protein